MRDDFNSVVGTQQDQVSKETMRKWITGISMPRTQRINDIERWLDVEIKITAATKNSVNKQLNHATLEMELNQLKNKLESLVAKVNEIKNLIT